MYNDLAQHGNTSSRHQRLTLKATHLMTDLSTLLLAGISPLSPTHAVLQATSGWSGQ